ncbi:BRCT domain-containing protein [Phyllosticta citriasiana]|uniref:BRCT domain-containing protein n=1 Tax=Phyllosticta citriasiana TaxID=595635 RepID=A0ABR1KF54_9PEZI
MADNSLIDGLAAKIFSTVSFTIIEGPSLQGERVAELKEALTSNGARFVLLNPKTGRIDDVRQITHVVSYTSDFPDYFDALDNFVHVVKPDWVAASFERKKTVNPRAYSPDPVLFMADVIVSCAQDIPEGDKEAIMGGVLAMGGQYSSAVTKFTTHVVALSTETDMYQLAKAKNLRAKIVLPHWFEDCLRLGKKIVEKPYELPDPEVLRATSPGPMAHYPSEAIRDATNPLPTELILSPREPRVLQVFSGKKIMLSEYLGLSDRIRTTIEELLRAGNAEVVTDVEDADIYVCPFREGTDYVKASQEGKDVGNLSWLYYLITHDKWTSPTRRLLHYPVPRNGIPGFEKYTLSISNYVGDARVYLENLATACGASFTRVMRQENTHLVTAHTHSEKCDAAREWNIHLVNHLWLEESFAKCKELSLTNPRYTHFPPRTNLGEVVGQTQIDREAVEQHFFSRPAKLAQKVDNATSVETDLPVRSTPMAKKGRKPRNSLDVQTPEVERGLDGKENMTPSSTGGRGAKNKALTKLHDLAPDIALYEKESKRKGGVIHGGRRASEPDGKPKEPLKRSLEPEDQEMEDAPAAKGRKTKKAKTETSPAVLKLMLSGDDRWIGKSKKETEDKNKLRAIGIHITEDPKEVNILCAPKIVRTKKFVAALSNAPAVVNTKFLDQCLKDKAVAPVEDYALQDKAGEKAQGIKLRETIARAEQNRHHLFRDWQIFVTEGVKGGWVTFKDIIEANGGACHLWKGRATQVSKRPRVRQLDADGDADMSDEAQEAMDLEHNGEADDGETLYLISSDDKEDVKLWHKFREMAKKAGMTPCIVEPNWLLSCAMAQEIRVDDKWEMNI